MIESKENIIYFTSYEMFYKWLEENYKISTELWVGYYRKSTGKDSMTWSSSVDAALCFGWIDGIRKSVDEDRYKIRFTPRKVKSVWSAVNVNKVKALTEEGKMKEEGLRLFNLRSDLIGYSTEDKNIDLDGKYEAQLKANEAAWLFFNNLAPSYKKNSIHWIMSAKREETRLKRLGILITSSEEGLKIPMLRKK